jgi:hypothetical protein
MARLLLFQDTFHLAQSVQCELEKLVYQVCWEQILSTLLPKAIHHTHSEWTVAVESQVLSGSCFTFRLPKAKSF